MKVGGQTLGLVAGNGALPLQVVQGAQEQGLRVVAAGLEGEVQDAVLSTADESRVFRLGRIAGVIRYLKNAGARSVVFIGGVKKTRLFSGVRPDSGALRLLFRLGTFQDDSALRAVAALFEDAGLEVVDARAFLRDAHLEPGVLSARAPTPSEWRDIHFGFELLSHLSPLDVGQTILVRGGVILAIEAIEGTDAAIRRAGELGRGKHPLGRRGIVLCKATKVGQDTRLDLPTLGPTTVWEAANAGVRVIAAEAGQTLLVDPQKTLSLCDENGISLVGVEVKHTDGEP
jgi:DUF1009 family protein